jgi:DNA invertase Pin-like site-specific DNA recombinase
MKKPIVRKLRCAVYARKSSEEGLDQEFNSLDAQREACEAYVASQKAEGWVLVPDRFDDGGFSGGTLVRMIFQSFVRLGSATALARALRSDGVTGKRGKRVLVTPFDCLWKHCARGT